MKRIFYFIVLLFSSSAIAQNFTMTAGTFNYDCSTSPNGILNDSGGAGGDYGNNENIVMTICPSNPGLGLVAQIPDFSDIIAGDQVCVYDGNNIAATLLNCFDAVNAGNLEPGSVVQATTDNVSGCLTFEFVSDGANTGSFEFILGCEPRCQTFMSSIASSTPPIVIENGDPFINICPGDNLTISGAATFPNNNDEYPQSEATSTFSWYWGDETEFAELGQTLTHTYNNAGGYVLRLEVNDVNGCRNQEDQVVKVRMIPELNFAQIPDTFMCVGEIDTLEALPIGVFTGNVVVGGTEYFVPPFFSGDSIPLPDSGSDAIYSTSVSLSGFGGGATVQNCGDIIEVCMNIEHSYTGDLDISLECPNGTTITLMDFPNNGGGTYLGQAIDFGTDPGIGWTYCFNTSGVVNLDDGLASGGFPSSFLEGDYSTVDPISDLVGCPLNGDWTLHIQDNLASDNGTLFNWELNIDACMHPTIDSFTMEYNLGYWDTSSIITQTFNDYQIEIEPSTFGLFPLTYHTADQFGCQYDTTYNIRVEEVEIQQITPDTTIFCDETSVQLSSTVFASSGNPISYFWTPFDGLSSFTTSNPVASPTSDITYNLSVSDGLCTNDSIVSVVVLAGGVDVDSIVVADVTCPGATDGSISIYTGQNGLQFSIDSGMTFFPDSIFTGLTDGFYDVLVSDGSDCDSSFVVEVASDVNLEITIDSTHDISCFGGNDGAIFSHGNGGSLPYSFSINVLPTQPDSTFLNLNAGVYTVTLTDGAGCTEDSMVTLFEPNELILTADNDSLDCFGDTDGEIQLHTTGGTVGFTFTIDDFATSQNDSLFTGQLAGNYTAIVEDGNGCLDTATVVIWEPDTLEIINVGHTDIVCNGDDDGEFIITPQGGVEPYMYDIGGAAQTDSTFTGVDGGVYTLTVTDANNCTATALDSIYEPTPLVLIEDSTTDISCFGDGNGIIYTSASGGEVPYTFELLGGATGADSTFTGLDGGMYQIVAMDNNGCTDTITSTILEPALLVLTADNDSIDCFGDTDGEIQLHTTGGTVGFTFTIDDFATSQNDSLFTGQLAGNYIAIVEDGNGCLDTTMMTIWEPDTLEIINVEHTDIVCNGDDDGEFIVTPQGGVEPYMYDIGGAAQTDSTFTGVDGGVYTLTVTDANNCTATALDSIYEPTPLVLIEDSTTDISCFGDGNGIIYTSASGGEVPYTFELLGGATGADSTFTGLDGGMYQIVAMDDNGCTDTITSTILEPALLVLTADNDSIDCFGDTDGEIQLHTTGGTVGFTFTIDDFATSQNDSLFTGQLAGNYTAIVEDGNGCLDTATVVIWEPDTLEIINVGHTDIVCNGDDDGEFIVTPQGGVEPYMYDIGGAAQTDSTFTGVDGGVYTLTVTDANNCTATALDSIYEPTPLVLIEDSTTDISCFGDGNGIIYTSASGGEVPYTFELLGGAIGADSTFTGLDGGMYQIVAMDNNGCTDTITSTILEPAQLTLSAADGSVLCNGDTVGQIQTTAGGGTMPYSYSIDNFTTSQTSDLFTNLGVGNYTIGVTDANNCSVVTTTAEIIEPTALVIDNIIPTDILCNGDDDGVLTVSVSGGTPNYQYSTDNVAFQANNQLDNLDGGTYTVYVQDANGCEIQQDNNAIFEPTALQITVDATQHITCFNGADGSITVSATEGTASYQYSIDGVNFQLAGQFNDLPAGDYIITVQDANGCEETTTTTLTAPEPIVASISVSPVSCHGGADASIMIENITGGTVPYTVSINNGPELPYTAGMSFDNLSVGFYDVEVFYNAACPPYAETVEVIEPTLLVFDAAMTTNVLCFGESTGTVILSYSGGTPDYTYHIENEAGETLYNETGEFIEVLPSGMYTTWVEDANGCLTPIENFEILDPNPLVLTIENIDSATCFDAEDGLIEVSATGDNPAFVYTISEGTLPIADTAFVVEAGIYDVTVTDEEGCTHTIEDVVVQQPDPVFANVTPEEAEIVMTETIQLSAWAENGVGTLSYVWLPVEGLSCTDCSNPVVMIFNDEEYSVTITDGNGCVSINSPTAYISVIDELEYFIPNAFTPGNGDETNDDFRVYGNALKYVDMTIYDRWGEKLYEGDKLFDTWDGTYKGVPQQPGVYTYFIKLQFLNDREVEVKGSVTLLR